LGLERMKVAVMTKVGEIELQERPVPKPRQGEILVRVKSVGICGSDIHYFIEGRIGDFIVHPPFVLGHECAGEVVEVGEGVERIKPGDKVALEPGIPCRICKFCLSGHYNLCPRISFWATPPVDGVFCEYVVHPEFLAYPLGQDISFEEGALVEPLAVGVYAVQRTKVEFGETALILGCGTIGLLTLQALKIKGVERVIAVDTIPTRLQKAKELGAEEVLNPEETLVEEEVMVVTKGEGVDLIFETAGSSATTRMAVDLASNGGKIILVGFPPPTQLDISKIIFRELNVFGSWRYANVYDKAVELVNDKKVDLKSIVTHRYSGLENVEEALFFASNRKHEAIKVLVNL